MYKMIKQMAYTTFLVVFVFALVSSQDKSNNLEDVRIYNKEAYDYQEHGRLVVDVLNVTSSSIHVNWSLPEMKFDDGVLESSRVVCETSNGYMLSKKHFSSRAAYRCENLDANTSYVVCVYMLEKSQSSNTKVLHYSCHKLRTHDQHATLTSNDDGPSMRTDSIVAVVFTLGYIIAMIIIGYATWRWKRKMKEQDEAKQKFAIEDEDYDEDDGMLNGGLRDTNTTHSHSVSGGATGAGGRGKVHVTGSGRYCYSASMDDVNSRKFRDNLKSSSNDLNSSTRAMSGSRGNNAGSGAFSNSDVVLERKSNSVEEVNGCLELKRNSRGSAAKLTDLSESGNSAEKKRPKSQSVEDSPVKVTEISF